MTHQAREIQRTGELTRHPWPADVFLQGGRSGLVFKGDGTYRTAFVEAFPAGTFLRGEGATVAEAEDAAWRKYQRLAACPAHPDHGPFERRKYRNGSGFCTHCGTWFSGVLPPLPEDPNRTPSRLEQLLNAVEEGPQE
ncbi:hypothetical protein [Amycolatopsis thermophila]|uniref:Uncharacterized protein n=1 Tax=Amycolatopsis thermophila TaxID=206084 RepID=A0ABU0EMP8_9PSEU|nr:hypothetical protein [Amycolatopsis thermophila]MDQ0376564.1 hypothetical protein [Amycolatopsis thermophila]